jgi:hypothetical protein
MKKKSKLFKYFTLRNNYFQKGDINLLEKITYLINEDVDGGGGVSVRMKSEKKRGIMGNQCLYHILIKRKARENQKKKSE